MLVDLRHNPFRDYENDRTTGMDERESQAMFAQANVGPKILGQQLAIAVAAAGEPGMRAFFAGMRRCPECATRLDEDGYCTDVGCVNCGKAVAALDRAMALAEDIVEDAVGSDAVAW